jgi:hypothetical protein
MILIGGVSHTGRTIKQLEFIDGHTDWSNLLVTVGIPLLGILLGELRYRQQLN